ncbi:MAG: carboxypeptidase regulatory-like domain-containing protein, partial [Vicinamibacteria bacterium]
MSRIFSRTAVLGWCSFLLVSALARAQLSVGTVEGLIRDESGGVLPGVQVVANSPQLIQKDLTVYSNEQGYYRLTELPPGTYSLNYNLQGFQTIKREGIILLGGQTLTIDAQLGIASLEEAVTVVGDSPVVDVRSAKLSFNYTEELVQNVPTQRHFSDMVTTIPGVESARPYGESPGNLYKENVFGAGAYANRYTMDGGNATDPTVSNSQFALFSYDIIEEVQVLKAGKSAEVGFAHGGYFNVVTKSGGNEFSGTASLYYQSEGTQGENLNETLQGFGITRSNEIVNDYDASVTGGGRIIRDKLWWFGSYRRQDRAFQVLGFPENVNDEVNALFWKNTWQVNPNHRVSGLFNSWEQRVDLFFFGFSPVFAAGPEVSML